MQVPPPPSYLYLIGIGSNIGDRRRYLNSSVQLLSRHAGQVVSKSRIYETPPMGSTAHGPFLNMAIVCASSLSPEDQLTMLQRIERQLGRVRTLKWGDRTVDLDILAIADSHGQSLTWHSPTLQVPHDEFLKRDFALVPAAEVAGEWIVDGKTVKVEAQKYKLNIY